MKTIGFLRPVTDAKVYVDDWTRQKIEAKPETPLCRVANVVFVPEIRPDKGIA